MSILVTGANGFIAQHTVQQLLSEGYTVIGTVRTASKGEIISQLLNNTKFSFVVVPDMGVAHCFDELFKNNTHIVAVLHIASPFRFNVESPENDILIPAIDGVKTLYDSILNFAPQVKRVVLTSSDAAARITLDDPSTTIDENTWSPLQYEDCKDDKVMAYLASKPIAERYAWNFVKENKVNFEMVSVLPSNTWGPQVFDESLADIINTSCQAIDEIVQSSIKSVGIAHRYGGWIDVRDAAKAHIIALKSDEAVNHRLVLVSSTFTSQTMYDIANREFPECGFFKGNPGSDIGNLAKITKMDYAETERILDFKYKSLTETLVDSIQQMLRSRHSK